MFTFTRFSFVDCIFWKLVWKKITLLPLALLARQRVEHMNQNMPIFPIYDETFAKYIDIQNT